MNWKKIIIIFCIIAVLGIGLGILFLSKFRDASTQIPSDVVMETIYGENYSFQDQTKKIRLLEFIYVNCQDICPQTTIRMNQLRKMLKDEGVFGKKVEFITITIDPKNDTREILQSYVKSATGITSDNEGWIFLRGTEENTKKVADAFRFMYRDPGNGNFVHSAFTYLVDGDNYLIENFTMGEGFDKDRAFERIMREIN